MTRPYATTVVAVKVLVEKNMIFEVLVVLHLRVLVEHRAMTGFIVGKDCRQTPSNLIGGLCDRRFVTRSGWTFDFEIVPVVIMKLSH